MKRRTFIQAVLGAASFAGLVRFRRAPRQRAGVRCVWQQNVSGDWNDPRNWLNGRVPQAGDDVEIPAFTVATMPADAPCLNSLLVSGAVTVNHPWVVDFS